jgi:hypothetical protein
VGILLVLPNGLLEVGTSSAPVAPAVTAQITIRDVPVNTSNDPDQYGTGLLSIDGTVTIHGSVKHPTFVRTTREALTGESTISVDQSVASWRVGDRIFLPDTRQVPVDHWFDPTFALHVEERIVQDISADGRVITMSSPLSFDHAGARDADGAPTVAHGNVPLLPHVGNLSRNVIIRSENPSGTRGHTLYTHRSTIAIRYAQFQDLGRTRAVPLHSSANHIGRYPLHIHHLWGPVNPSNTGYQFVVQGNAVSDSLKWPIAVHGSHYGLIKQNVVFGGGQLTGAGIAIEDGTETENLFEENFVVYILGSINPERADLRRRTARRPALQRNASGRRASTIASSTMSRRAAATPCSRSCLALVGSSSYPRPRTSPRRRDSAARTWPMRPRRSPSHRSISPSGSFGETKSTDWLLTD